MSVCEYDTVEPCVFRKCPYVSVLLTAPGYHMLVLASRWSERFESLSFVYFV